MTLVLHHKCLVHHLLESREVVSYQLILQSSVQTIQEELLLLLIISHILWGIPRQLNEFVTVLTHRHTTLFQTEELLLLELDHSIRDMVRSEVILEL
jgi:hypothetical protein